jgi:phosphoglucosamine mutase
MFEPVPQLLKNVPYEGDNPMNTDVVKEAISDATAQFGNHGRILVRPSGTEALIRVMAEGDDPAMVQSITDKLAEIIAKAA